MIEPLSLHPLTCPLSVLIWGLNPETQASEAMFPTIRHAPGPSYISQSVLR